MWRNPRVIDVINELRSFSVEVYVHDPLIKSEEADCEYNIKLTSWERLPRADAIVVAVAHQARLDRPVPDFLAGMDGGGCFVDEKSRFDKDELHAAGLSVWCL